MRTVKRIVGIVCLAVMYYVGAWSWVDCEEALQLTGYLHVFAVLMWGVLWGLREVISWFEGFTLYRRLKNYHAEEVGDDTFTDE
jgi:hypothetical protein